MSPLPDPLSKVVVWRSDQNKKKRARVPLQCPLAEDPLGYSNFNNTNGQQIASTEIKLEQHKKRARLTSYVEVSAHNISYYGLLERIVKDMSLDVVIEIFSYLQPLELLYLSRTTRELRIFLMSQASSAAIWRTSRTNVFPKLPPIPEGLSEPLYASLAFEASCYVCGLPCENVFWASRIRLHGECKSEVFFTVEDLPERLPQLAVELKELGDLAHVCHHGQIQKHNSTELAMLYCRLIVEKHCREYVDVKDDPGKLEKWRQSREQHYINLEKWAGKCNSWQSRVFMLRRKDIISRLKDVYGVYGLDTWRFRCHPLVQQTKLLTEDEWGSIKPVLVQSLKDTTAYHIRVKQDRPFQNRTLDFRLLYNAKFRNGDQILMPVGDFLASPSAQSINHLIHTTPRHIDIRDDIFPTHIERISGVIAGLSRKWVLQKARELKQVIRENHASYLSLRKTVFQCKACLQVLWVPQVYVHDCPSIPIVNEGPPDWKYLYNPYNTIKNLRIWKADSFRCHASGTECARKFMKLCGAKNLEELAKINPEVECMHKVCYGEGKHLVRWRKIASCNFPYYIMPSGSQRDDTHVKFLSNSPIIAILG
ncbi:hypothetical protein E1B28_012123 [Marasmius oreades]|uniref:F-box domain-containing protein n=1 Tax=Marasmius oreades TaxID=181124 RepID=A0A9P7UMW7_9AGAR|nr:uncharacterized protein E1B28_012123 [Marasmius oreades]KAG7088097.1 hypothetical protein E1B28_012123 [Marasmius oreades]